MNKFVMMAFAGVLSITMGCTRIETGEVGLRVGFDKQTQMQELNPGSFNQTLIGEVLTFPVRDIAVNLDNVKPQTSDNSTLSEFDLTVIYSINPASAGELYTTKSRAFHITDEAGDTYLMYNYITTLARTAAYKAVAKFPAMESVRKRDEIEEEVSKLVLEALKHEKLESSLIITKVQVRNIVPALSIVETANEAIAAQNRLIAKTKEVEIAEQEAARQAFLSRPANLDYMRAQAELNVSEAIKEGKVNTIIVPHNMTMLGSVGK